MVLWWIEWNKGIWRNISEIRRRSPIFFFRPIKLSSLKFVLSPYLIPLPPSIYICITYLAAPIFFHPQHSFNEYKLLHFKNLLKLSRISRPQNCDCVKKYYRVRHSFSKLTWVYNPPNSGESSCAQCGKILRKKLAEISRRRRSILGLCWCCECERAGGWWGWWSCCEKKFSRVSNIQYLEPPTNLRQLLQAITKEKGWDASSRWGVLCRWG